VTTTSRSSLLIVFLVVFIDLLGFGIVLPLLPRYGDYFQADRWTLGLLMAAFSAMQFVFAPIWGRVSDRIGRRPVLLLGLAGSVVFYGLFGVVSGMTPDAHWLGAGPIAWLMVCRIGAGIAGATIPTAQAYIADVTDAGGRGKGMALIGAAFGMGFTFGPLLAAAFVSTDPDAAPSSMPGYLAAGLSAVALLGAIARLPESLREGSRAAGRRFFDGEAFRAAVGQPVLATILATIFLTTFAFAAFESTLALLTQMLGMSERHNFYIFAYLGFVLTLAQGLLVRRLIPRVGERRSALFGTVLLTAGLVLVSFINPKATPGEGGLGLGYLMGVLPVCIVGFAATTPALHSLLSLRSRQDSQGAMLGLGQSMSALARILGPVVGIVLIKSDARYPYWTAAAVMVLGVLMVLALGERPAGGESSVAVPTDA
jgi:DHA1 family tetracycline resistance protein-like MFS transporter